MGKILVIAEKPSAGKDIARILGVTKSYNGYMENEEYIVSWAVGHLVTLKDPEDRTAGILNGARRISRSLRRMG